MKKRYFGGSTGDTPGKPGAKKKKSRSKPARKSLFGKCASEEAESQNLCYSKSAGSDKQGTWKDSEMAALIQFIGLYWNDSQSDGWPSFKNPSFWESCAEGIAEVTGCPLRTGGSCRTRVLKFLKNNYSLSEAEEAYGVNYFESLSITSDHDIPVQPLSPIFSHSPSARRLVNSSNIGDILTKFIMKYKQEMHSRMKKQLINYLLKLFIEEEYGLNFLHFVKGDMLEVILSGMEKLYTNKKDNLVYKLSQVVAENKLKLDRMPFGLLDYNIKFFAAKSSVNLKMEASYAAWQETMLAHFGHKWVSLNRGPMWQYDDSSTELEDGHNDLQQDLQCVHQDLHHQDQQNIQNDPEQMEPASCNDVNDVVLEALVLSGIDVDNFHNNECNTPNETVEIDVDKKRKNAVSNLWSNLTSDEVKELEHGGNPTDIEKYHGVVRQNDRKPNQNKNIYHTDKAFVNIAGTGSRHLLRKIQSYGFKRDAEIQVSALKKIQAANPKARWWIKADACDVRKGLRESVRGKWAGDEDLDDGELQKLRHEYEQRVDFVKSLRLDDKDKDVVEDLSITLSLIEKDMSFLLDGLQSSKEEFERKKSITNTSEELLMELAWGIVGYEGLVKDGSCLKNEIGILIKSMQTSPTSEDKSLARHLQNLRQGLERYLQQLYSKKRKVATHIMVFMIADELRNFKPYALPVRVLPYKSITDSRLRELAEELKTTMINMDMKVVGFVTDGEFNSLRTAGKERPISIIQLISDSRNEARSMRVKRIEKSLTMNANGMVKEPHPAVPLEDVQWLDDFMKNEGHGEQITLVCALKILKRKLFPFSYDPCTWIQGKTEGKADILKSIMAIYLFRAKVAFWKTSGVDFSKHLVIPEIDKVTKEKIHQREDHNHLLKRIIGCLREGQIPDFEVRYLRDALHDPGSGLTYEALTGKNKQSVPDCERIISAGVVAFMEEQHHEQEANILSLIRNWHKAVDGRGLSEDRRSRYCLEFKYWILRDWIPYLDQVDDYSAIDVNRPIKGICGLTREVIVGLLANLETREQRRQEYSVRDMPPEHPRASSTDDVEGFFSLLHEMLGNNFDLKQFFDEFPKLMNEFMKRIDPELPFFYWTGGNHRFHAFELPSFNKPSTSSVERLDQVKISRRGDPGVFVANRASLPQRNKLTVRANFHKAPVALPPVDNVSRNI